MTRMEHVSWKNPKNQLDSEKIWKEIDFKIIDIHSGSKK